MMIKVITLPFQCKGRIGRASRCRQTSGPLQRPYVKELDIDMCAFRKAPDIPAPSGKDDADFLGCEHCCYHCLVGDVLDKRVKCKHEHVGWGAEYKCDQCACSTDDTGKMKRHQVTCRGVRVSPVTSAVRRSRSTKGVHVSPVTGAVRRTRSALTGLTHPGGTRRHQAAQLPSLREGVCTGRHSATHHSSALAPRWYRVNSYQIYQ